MAVALLDSAAPEHPAEFGYLMRDWIEMSKVRNDTLAFGVLDWSYTDGGNPKLFESYGISRE